MDSNESSELSEPIAALQAAWQRSSTGPDLESLLRRMHDLTPQQLLDICLVDQMYRFHTQAPLRVEDYLRLCPALSSEPACVFELAYGEFRMRRQLQQVWPVGEIESRFPEFASSLHKQLEVGCWFEQAASSTSPSFAKIGTQACPDRIGPYQLDEPLAHGGMGVIFRARHTELKRVVALKMIRPDRVVGEVDRMRFRNESMIIAQFDHPHIVPIYDVGEEEGIHYFAMKLLEGGDLQQHCRHYLETPRDAAQVMAQVGEAVHHAHQCGVLHRDIKPSNILLDELGRPHVTDFGLARSLNTQHHLTHTGDLVGTPTYLAPEQLMPGQRPLTIATDVYGLGAVLYTLLTGVPPFDSPDLVTTLKQIQQREPVSPRRLNPLVDRDLECICLKALAKLPMDRYRSAGAFTEDLQRYLSGEEIHARPAPWWRRRWRWICRHPDLAIATGLLLVIGSILLMVLGWQALRMRQLRGELDASLLAARIRQVEAEVNRTEAAQLRRSAEALKTEAEVARAESFVQMQRAREAAYATTIRNVDDAWRSRDTATFTRLLEDWIPQPGETDVRGFEWFLLDQYRPRAQYLPVRSSAIRSVAYSPDGRYLAAAGDPGQIEVWEDESGRAVHSWPSHTTVRDLAFSNDSRLLAAVGDDGFLRIMPLEGGPAREWRASDLPLWHVAFIGHEPRLACCAQEGGIRLIDGRHGEIIATLETSSSTVHSMAVAPDGNWLVYGDQHGQLTICDLVTLQTVYRFPMSSNTTVKCLAVSADGTMVASASTDNWVRVFRIGHPWSFELILVGQHFDRVQEIAFSGDGKRLASCDKNGNVQIWRLPSLPPEPTQIVRLSERTWQGHPGRAYSLAFHPRREQLTTGGQESQVAIWSLHQPKPWITLGKNALESARERSLTFTADSSALIVAAADGLQLWNLFTHHLESQLSRNGDSRDLVATSRNGVYVAAASSDPPQIEVWKKTPAGYQPAWECASTPNDTLTFSPDGDRLIATSWLEDKITVYQSDTGHLESTLAARQTFAGEFSPDGRQLAFTKEDNVIVWDWGKQQPVRELKRHLSTVTHLAYSPDGRKLASCGRDRQIILWDLQSGEPLHCLMGHQASVLQLVFMGNDRLLSLSEDGSIFLWHAELGSLLCRLRENPADACFYFAVSPNQRWLATRLRDERFELLDLSHE